MVKPLEPVNLEKMTAWQTAAFSLLSIFIQDEATDFLLDALHKYGLLEAHFPPEWRIAFHNIVALHNENGKVVNPQAVFVASGQNGGGSIDQGMLAHAWAMGNTADNMIDPDELATMPQNIQACVNFAAAYRLRQSLARVVARIDKMTADPIKIEVIRNEAIADLSAVSGSQKYNVSAHDELMTEMNDPALKTGIQTGIKTFDERLGGLWENEILTLLGRAKGRKSSIAHTIITNLMANPDDKTPIVFGAFENGVKKTWYSLVAQLAVKRLFEQGLYEQTWMLGQKQIPLHSISPLSLRRGMVGAKWKTWDNRQVAALTWAQGVMTRAYGDQGSDRKLYILGREAHGAAIQRVRDMLPHVRAVQAQHKRTAVVMVDHALEAAPEADDDYHRLLVATGDAMALTKSTECAMLLLSQLSTDGVRQKTSAVEGGARGGGVADHISDAVAVAYYMQARDDEDARPDLVSIKLKLSRWAESGDTVMDDLKINPQSGYVMGDYTA